MRPRIGVPIPTSADLAYNRQNWPAYADALLASGADPIQFPLGLARRETFEAASGCAGFVLPGSPADVEPGRYGQSREEACAPLDEARETVDEMLLEIAERSRRPLLAICFGLQMLNVSRGGTLVQDLGVLPVNHSSGRSVAVAHTVLLRPSSVLSELADDAECRRDGDSLLLPVNSSHHQAIGIPGEGLWVSARCPQDGVAESVEGVAAADQFLLGVQWHPERTLSTSETSRKIFSRLIQEASAWRSANAFATA